LLKNTILLQSVLMHRHGLSPRSMPPLTPLCYASSEFVFNIRLTSYSYFATIKIRLTFDLKLHFFIRTSKF